MPPGDVKQCLEAFLGAAAGVMASGEWEEAPREPTCSRMARSRERLVRILYCCCSSVLGLPGLLPSPRGLAW